MEHFDRIQKIFEDRAGYVRTKDILNAGIHFSHLKKLEQKGIIVQVKRGHYRWEGMTFLGNDLPEVARLVPNGIFCLFTSAEYHGLTTYQPWQHHIAVERSGKVVLPPQIHVKLWYCSKPLLAWGVMNITTEGGSIRVFDLERTVCDLVKFRNKTGNDTMLEAIRNYLARKDKNLTLLLHYARLLRVEKIIKPYLEILL
jgi:predicted transcriptional regulator of viral defense system